MHSDYVPSSQYDDSGRRMDPYYGEGKADAPQYLPRNMSMAGILSSVRQPPSREYYPAERYMDNREVYDDRRRYEERRREPPRYGYEQYPRYDDGYRNYYDYHPPPPYRYEDRGYSSRGYYDQRPVDAYREPAHYYPPPEPRGYGYERYPPPYHPSEEYYARDKYPVERNVSERNMPERSLPEEKRPFPIVTIQLRDKHEQGSPSGAKEAKPNRMMYDRNGGPYTSASSASFYGTSKRPTYLNGQADMKMEYPKSTRSMDTKADHSTVQAYITKVGASVEQAKCKIVKLKQCHLCSEPQAVAANCCPKGFLKHSFCPHHLKSMLNIEWEDVEEKYTLCAVCAKRCTCPTCYETNKEEAKRYEDVVLKNELRGMENSPDAPEVRKRPRGRPRKDANPLTPPLPKRPRGRPRKRSEEPAKVKRPRGRPRKVTTVPNDNDAGSSVSPPQPPIQYVSAFQNLKQLSSNSEAKMSPTGKSIVELKDIKVAKKSIMPNRNELSEQEQRMLAEPKSTPVHHATTTGNSRDSIDSSNSGSSGSSEQGAIASTTEGSANTTMKESDPIQEDSTKEHHEAIAAVVEHAVSTTIKQAEADMVKDLVTPTATAPAETTMVEEEVMSDPPEPVTMTLGEQLSEVQEIKEKKKIEEPLKEKEPRRQLTPRKTRESPSSTGSAPFTRRQSRHSVGVVSKRPIATRRASRTEQYYSEDSNFDHCNVCDKTGNLLCCDRCPRSFHMDCIGVTKQDLPNGDWHCSECQVLPHGFAELSDNHTEMTAKEKMEKIVDSFLNHEFVDPFRVPVDKKLTHYYETIKEPMDFQTVSTKIQQDEYPDLESFAADVRLIWKNCLEFNVDGSCITRMAECLSDQFETLYQIVS